MIDTFEQLLIRHTIKCTPVLCKQGRSKQVVIWLAGRKELASNGWQNITPTDQFAYGLTPGQSVERLLAGRTAMLRDGSGYVEGRSADRQQAWIKKAAAALRKPAKKR